MLKHTLLALAGIFLMHALNGQDAAPDQDTIILQRIDTTFAFGHKIQAGQTLYSLSKVYKTSLEYLHNINPTLMETELTIGDTLLIPLSPRLISKAEDLHADQRITLLYTVEEGETLFAIARRWLNVETNYLRDLNNLESSVLSLHSKLVLGYLDALYLKAQSIDPEDVKIAEMDAALIEANKSSVQGMEAVIEQGKAIWKASKSAGNKPFILHRKAKLNSLVQIYNPMTGKKIHAKVVGRIPERNYDDNVMVVLTPFLAEALKARDKAFFVKMKYTM